MKNVNLIKVLVLAIVFITPSLSYSQEGGMGREQRRARQVERLKSQGFSDAEIEQKIQERRAKREAVKKQCESQGLTREQCRAQFGKGRHRPR